MSWGVALRNAVGLGLSGIPSLKKTSAYPTVVFNFLSGSLDPRITFTRASSATYFNSSGTLTSAATDVARFDYNTSTLTPLGLLIEEQRTNSIRNNTGVGGSAGVFPTNWSSSFTIDGLTLTIGAPVTQTGLPCVDIRINGTSTASRTNINLVSFETVNQIAAAVGQTWTGSAFVKLQAGSLTNILNVGIQVSERDAAGAYLSDGTTLFVPTSAAINTQRQTVTRTLASATTAFVRPTVCVSYNSGVAIDITLRIASPQLEQGAFATSVIQTSTTAITRAADSALVTGTNFSSWYNNAQGTVMAEFGAYGNGGASKNPGIIQIDDATTNNYIRLFAGSSLSPVFQVTNGGTNQAYLSFGTLTTTAVSKIAGSYLVNNLSKSFNGTYPEVDTSGTLPTLNRMLIGSGSSGVNETNGYIRSFKYYPIALTDGRLQAITL